jgi:hypothetical protein
MFFVLCSTFVCSCQSDKSLKSGTATKSNVNEIDPRILKTRNKYKANEYVIEYGAKLNPDNYGNLVMYDSVPYYNMLDEMFIIYSTNEDYPDFPYLDYNYRSMTNTRNVSDFEISDYKNGVCIHEYFGKDKDLVIPPKLDGKPVVKIGGYILQEEADSFLVSPFYMKRLRSVTIPSSVKEIAYEAFSSMCSSNDEICENIYVDVHNPYYSSVDGILYNKDKTCLLKVPSNYNKFTINIPEGTVAVYSICSALTQTVYIPSSVISFGETIDKYGNSDYGYNGQEDSPYYPTLKSPETLYAKSFIVARDNKYYSDKDGSLYNKEGNLVILPTEYL